MEGRAVGLARAASAALVCSGKSRQVSDEQREEIPRAFGFKLSAGRRPAPTSTRPRGCSPRIGGTLRGDDPYETASRETLRRVLVHDVRRRRGLVRRGGLGA